jgi:adenine-specific DNA-methyltransferase
MLLNINCHYFTIVDQDSHALLAAAKYSTNALGRIFNLCSACGKTLGIAVAYIEDKIQQVQDKELRGILLAEVKKLKKEKKFGLVFEEHVPELVPVYSAPICPRSTVALKDGDLLETLRVKRIKDGSAFLSKDVDGNEFVYSLEQLVVQRFGEAIYPALKLKDSVVNGGDRPFHTLIEADNYHALQLLEYLYAGQVDCIYIDPPYNTGAKDWKYNNNYVDVNDSWRHSKWLAMMKKRLLLAKDLLTQDGVIFVSIDDGEACHLKLLMDSVFGASQFIGQFVWKSRQNKDNRTKNGASIDHEYVFAYGQAVI